MALANLLVVIFLISVSIVPETRAQALVQCYSGDTCTAALQPAMTIEDCCLNNPEGRSFQGFGGEPCDSCIVYGFFNDSVAQLEQGQGYMVRVGYLKGATAQGATNLIFDIRNNEGTAREGTGFDYTVNTNMIRVIASAPDRVENVVYILRTDSIAQEINETFTIELTFRAGTTPPTGAGVFFRNTFEVTIIDSDDVLIIFTEDDFRENERNMTNPDSASFMPVRVSKNSRIANPIVLDVIPLTVMDATNQFPGLPNNVPENNPFSPPFATMPDFDNAVIRITFDPDENADDNERFAPIAITNDAFNEATEQVFIVHLVLVNSSNPSSIDLSQRATSLCRIIDDDPISIGFELPSYTYNEPMFDITIEPDGNFFPPNNLTAYGPVFLIKENNVMSEQLFMIVIQVSDAVPEGSNPATIDEDYSIGAGGTVTIQFPPNLQSLNVQFDLFSDNIPEGTEAFLVSSSRQDTLDIGGGTMITLPDYLPPTFASTFINILDDDPIIIGFENTTFTVDESVGTFDVFVVVTSPPVNVELVTSVDLVIQTIAGNATGGADYRELIAGNFDVFLTFDNENRRAMFSVQISDDNLLEDIEDFNLELRFDPFLQAPPSGVILNPDVATVYIQDDDNVVIGFLNTPYSVNETEGIVALEVGVIDGFLEREVVVLFSTIDSNATDGFDYTGIQNMLLTFGPSSTSATINVTILNDDVYELTEIFNATLSFDGDPVPRVTLSPDAAVATIVDDDELVFGFEPTEYSVNEGAGGVSLGITFSSGNAGEFVPHVILSTQDGTAISSGDEADYDSIVAQSVSFTNTDRSQNVFVTIFGDSFTEINETFSAMLSSVFIADSAGGQALPLSAQESRRLILRPNTADITILDDDDATIGFVSTTLTVDEGDGTVSFEIGVLSGILRINVSILFETTDGSAHAGDDYDETTMSLVFFDQATLSAPVGIIDDFLVETPETFLGQLSPDGVLPPNVFLNPVEATATIIDNDDIVIGFDPDMYEVNEDAGTVRLFVAVLNGTISEERAIPITISTADRSAQAGSDYTATTTVLTFSNLVTRHSVDIAILDDNLLEIDEIFAATLSAEDAQGVMLDPQDATVTILDDDEAVIGFDPSEYTTTEGVDQFANLNIRVLSGELGRDVVVVLNTQSGTATSGQDFAGIVNRQLTFTPTINSVTVSVDILDDNFLEDLEIFSANISSQVPRLTLDPSEATVSIIDDDAATFGFDRGQYSVVENEMFVTVTIRQVSGGPLNRNVFITLVTGDGTAISSGESDFEAHSVDLTFGPGITERDVNIRIIDDLRLEIDEQFNSTVFLTVTDPAITLDPGTAGITIIDDDVVVIGFERTLYDVSENDGQATIDVVLVNGILRRPVVVTVSTRDGTALSGSDYSSIGSIDLTFDRDTSAFPILVDILDDQIHELDENFLGELTTSDEDAILSPNQTTVRILDNDVVTFTFRQPIYTFMENIGTGTVCVDRIGDTDQTITVVVNGAIQSGSLTRMLTFTPETSSMCIDFPVDDDDIALEDPEEFTWTIDPIPIPRVELSTNTTRIIIIDDDPLILTLVKGADVPEGSGVAEACITFSNPFAREFQVLPSLARPPNNSVPAFATPDVDFSSTIPPLVATPGDSEICFEVTIDNDNLVEEPLECFMVSFTAEQLENLMIGNDTAVCCIIDDDRVTIGFDPETYSVNEADGIVTLTVRVLDGELARPVAVTFNTQDGTATSVAPVDYISPGVDISLQFSSDQLVQTVVIAIEDDDIVENIENFEGLLSTIDPAVILAPMTADVNIVDDDVVVVGFQPDEYEVFENEGSVTLTVRLLNGILERDVTVFFETSPGTATSAPAEDYVRTTELLTFSPTTDANDVTVTIINDNIHEARETFFGILDAQGQPVLTNPDTATVVIVDDSDAITIGFERTEYSVPEGEQEMVCAVLTSGVLETDVVVTVTSSDISANVNSDYEAVSQSLTFNATTSRVCFDTVTVDDDLLEDNETYRLTLTSDEPGLTLDPDMAVVTIVNDDEIVIGLTETVFEVTEGDGVRVEICARVFSGELERDAVVTLQTADGTAVSQGTERDYQSLIEQLTFTSSVSEICRNVTINNDAFYEDRENFNVFLTTTDGDVTLNPDQGEVTILDEDEVVIGFVDAPYTVLEADTVQRVCARLLEGTLRADVDVQFTTLDGGATEPADYTETTTTFTFSDAQQENCADIPIIPDNILEGAEDFSAQLETNALRVTLDPEQAEIVIVEDQPLIIGFIDAPYSTREESGFATVTVGILSTGVVLDDDFVVRLSTSDLTGNNAALAGSDYVPLVTDLTFNGQVKLIDVNVTILDDNIVEFPEVFLGELAIVTMGPAAPDAVLNPATATITIEDEEDTVTIGLTETLITVDENVGTRQVCAVVIDGDLERPVIVDLDLFPDTATAGEDYVLMSYELLFDATNRGPICRDVTILTDVIYENEETLTYNLTTDDRAVELDPSGGVMVIQDDDEIIIGWDQELYEVSENVGQARLCVVIFQGTLAVTLPALNIATRDGSATRGGGGVQQDYIPTPTPDQFVFSAANQGRMCTNIPIVDDLILEETIEDFFADLSFTAGQEPPRVIIQPSTTEVEIEDNDPLVIGFVPTTYTVNEGSGPAVLIVQVISGDLETQIVVNLTTFDDSAVAPDDYDRQDVQITFGPASQTVQVPVPIVDDTLDEESVERFTASLVQDTVNPRVTVNPDEAEVRIIDNDVVTIGFERTSYMIRENNTRAEMVCALVMPPPQLARTVVVTLASSDDTATASEDYNAISTELTFDGSNSRRCVEFTAFEDDVVDPNETFTVTLTGGNDVNLTPDTAIVTITDDVVIRVSFVEPGYTFGESQGVGMIGVMKSEDSDVPFTVRVRGGPSTSSPIEQSAAAIDVEITFGAGPNAPDVINIPITITDDDVTLEVLESYEVTLEIIQPAPNVILGIHPTTTVNVEDDDFLTVGFGSDGVSVVESSGQFMMCVVKDKVALQDITVTISSVDGTAISDLDYTPGGIPSTVTIPTSDDRTCFDGPIIDDLIALEPDEFFDLNINSISPVDPRILRGNVTTRITIIDDDIVRVRYEEELYLFREESGLATVCLIKDLETAAEFPVDSFTTDDTAMNTLDYTGGTFGVTFGMGANNRQCINIDLLRDNIRENREDFFVDLNLPDTGPIRRGNPSRTTVAIEDTGIPANDTVIGDPLMTVPILVSDSDLATIGADRVSLCYEIHGRADANFNLVTDQCATVNAHYHDLTSYLNVIDQVGVRAVDDNGMCRNIQVDVNGCTAAVDGAPLEGTARYSSGGISVRRYSNRVRISVPNCNELSLVMWVICERRTLEDPFGGDGTITGDMIKFVVMRGLNFGHRQAHGLLGQFWNIPVSVEPFTGVDRNGNPVPERYVINITSSFSNEERSYTGWLYDLTWSFEEGPCLYVGNRQAGPIYEVKDPNDPIIEGRYSEYLVPDLFSEEEYTYGLFEEDNCLESPTGGIPTNLPN